MSQEIIEEYLKNYTKETSRKIPRIALTTFFDCIKKDPQEYLVDVRLLNNLDKISKMNQYEDDIKNYLNFLKQLKTKQGKSLAGSTIRQYISAIRLFFAEYRIQFDDVFWNKTIKRRLPQYQRISMDEALTTDQLAAVIGATSIQWKSFFMVLATSGMRIGECCSFKLSDIDFDTVPTKITLHPEYCKTGIGRNVFITDETSRYLKVWLQERESYLNKMSKHLKRFNLRKSADDVRVFPFEEQTARKKWDRLLNDVNLDERLSNGIRKYHVHTLRKYFRSNFVKAELPRAIDIVEELMGHKGYLNGTYIKFEQEELKNAYIIAQNKLLVFDRVLTNEEAEEERRQQKNRINFLEEQMAQLLKQQDYYKQLAEHGIIQKDKEMIDDYTKHKENMKYIREHGLESWRKLQLEKRKK